MDFDELVDQYEKPIFNLIYRLLSDRDEAADLTQETFLAAYKSYANFQGGSSVYTWLYRIAVNKCKNKYKERDLRKQYESLSLDCDGGEDTVVENQALRNPHEALQRKELKELIVRAISELPPDYRIVAVLRDLQGLSYQEVAQAADLSVDVVRTRLARARGMLKRKLIPYLGG
ncbi:MAG: sigma-70 family RNA polymerase sigma factor [Armatimonadota bacterium]|nr:sigma-70 family RNA polymerase sigma factor [bacterium]